MAEPALRLFVALALPAAVREELLGWQASAVSGVDGVRSMVDSGLHLTLCFLGAQPAAAVDAVLAAARAGLAGCRAAPLALGEPLWLPRQAPRVLAVRVVDDAGTLATVQERLAAALAAGGWYERERRPFLGHVTVARVARGARVRAVVLDPPAPLAFTGEEVVLLRSHLGRGGARYEALGSVALGTGA